MLVAGNWKMHKTVRQALDFVGALAAGLPPGAAVEVVLCPPFTALHAVGRELAGGPLQLGAQDVHPAASGAHTGAISVEMLRDVGCAFVIVGHSERRAAAGETDAQVRDKARAALAGGLRPIVCVGETLAQREAGRTEPVVRAQVDAALGELGADLARIAVAYEPVWAIGTGRHATPEQVQQVHGLIRERLAALGGALAARSARILYGGSLNPDNAASIFAQRDVDGGLVGGASLDPRSLVRIVEAAAACPRAS
jgi:triosephosphate isomerase